MLVLLVRNVFTKTKNVRAKVLEAKAVLKENYIRLQIIKEQCKVK